MKKLSFLFFLFAAFGTLKAQISVQPTPPQYAVNSGIPFYSESGQMYEIPKYWYVICLNNGQRIYCHGLKCKGDDFIAVFEVTEIPSGKIIEKELTYKYKDVKYTSVLR
jgi:hypothetical protein